MDTKILNNSLQKSLNIQLYNNHFFKPHSPSILQPSRDRPYKDIDAKAFQSNTPLANPFPNIKELFHATNAPACNREKIPVALAGLTHLKIQEYKHKLLFIKFAPVRTLRPRWYLVQVDLDSTLTLHPATPPNCMYYNIHKSNKLSRWWSEWHKYSR